MRDTVDLDAYRASLLGARAVIPQLLDRFAGKGIHATWATVGFLFFDERDELLAHLPARRPGYADPNLSPYEHVLRIGPNEHKDAGGARSLAKRAGRLADSYVNLSGHHGQQVVSCAGHLVDVPSSRFLRPFSPRLAALDPLRMRRIRASMDHAAEHGLIYNLWWHPHNFGRHPDESLRFLSHVLDHFEQLSMERGMVSRRIGELIPQDASA